MVLKAQYALIRIGLTADRSIEGLFSLPGQDEDGYQTGAAVTVYF